MRRLLAVAIPLVATSGAAEDRPQSTGPHGAGISTRTALPALLRAGRTLEALARNSLGERTVASPALSGGRLFIRGDEHLIPIGAKP